MYLVIFEGTGVEGGNYRGIRTMVGYQNQTEFEAFQRESKNPDKIVAQGVTEIEARRLIDETPIEAYFDAAVSEAFAEGGFDPNMFELKLANILMLMEYRKTDR